MKMLGKIYTFFEEGLIIIMLSYMAIMNFLNVVFRYLFASSFSFTEELTVTVFVWVTMMGVAAGFKRSAHLGMSFVVDFFHGKARALFAAFAVICSLIFMCLVFYYGIVMVQHQINMGATTPILRMPQAVQGLSMPVGAAFVIVRIIEAGIKTVRDYWKEGGTKA